MGVVFFPSLPFMGVMLFPSFRLGNAPGEGGASLALPSLFLILLLPPLFSLFSSLFSLSFFFFSSFSFSSFLSFSPFPFLSSKLFCPLFLLFFTSLLSFSFSFVFCFLLLFFFFFLGNSLYCVLSRCRR